MNGQDLICLRDPESLAEQPLFLSRILLFLVSRMDGTHALRDIQADYFRAAGEILPMETLENLVTQLDEQHYLDGPSFQSFYQALVKGFRDAVSRPARHAGSAYAENAEELISQIQGYFSLPEGPRDDVFPQFSRPLRGLIVPHIDFARGGPTYAHACRALELHPAADTYIIFGTCHTPMPQRFSISKKNYETPLGAAQADQDFMWRGAHHLVRGHIGENILVVAGNQPPGSRSEIDNIEIGRRGGYLDRAPLPHQLNRSYSQIAFRLP